MIHLKHRKKPSELYEKVLEDGFGNIDIYQITSIIVGRIKSDHFVVSTKGCQCYVLNCRRSISLILSLYQRIARLKI